MSKRLILLLFVVGGIAGLLHSCSSSSSTGPGGGGNEPVYPVTATVLNPAGAPQGGAILKLKGKGDSDPVFATVTDSTGRGTIQAPAGQQTLVAKIGSVFLTEVPVNVLADTQGTTVTAPIVLQQNTALKVLVVKASAEQLENVLRDSVIGFTVFDSIYVYALNDSVAADSNRALNFLLQYTIIFSDCDGGSEYSYAPLARVYGRYLQAGGKIYGGHYNYYHLQKIFSPFYTTYDYQSPAQDTIFIQDVNLRTYIGFTEAQWRSADSRGLSGYEKFTDLPPATKVYAVIRGTSPPICVIAENYIGSGKYLWTDYHNQDVINAVPRDQRLVKIVQYFLYTL